MTSGSELARDGLLKSLADLPTVLSPPCPSAQASCRYKPFTDDIDAMFRRTGTREPPAAIRVFKAWQTGTEDAFPGFWNEACPCSALTCREAKTSWRWRDPRI